MEAEAIRRQSGIALVCARVAQLFCVVLLRLRLLYALQMPVQSELRDLGRYEVDGGVRIRPRRRLEWVTERRTRQRSLQREGSEMCSEKMERPRTMSSCTSTGAFQLLLSHRSGSRSSGS